MERDPQPASIPPPKSLTKQDGSDASDAVSTAEERDATSRSIESILTRERPRALSTLVRLVGDMDLAEDALQDALAAAIERWPTQGVPENPFAWLVSAARFKAIDVIRRQAKRFAPIDALDLATVEPETINESLIDDDLLRLIFICCHPDLPSHSQIALTLREVCGLSTDAIARAFLVAPETIGQRIVRAKAKIRESKIPFEIPAESAFAERLDNALSVTYLVFNEGYFASSGADLTQAPLTTEAIRLGTLLAKLAPQSEVLGLLALMLLNESRRQARTDANGDMILLEDQDRTRWNQELIASGLGLVERIQSQGPLGPYGLQAAIAATHATAPNAASTGWTRIAELYDELCAMRPSPIVELNRAVAIAMRDGPEAGLTLIRELIDSGALANYGLAHSALADLLRRLGRSEDALRSYAHALDLTRQEPERRFIQRRIDELTKD